MAFSKAKYKVYGAFSKFVFTLKTDLWTLRNLRKNASESTTEKHSRI